MMGLLVRNDVYATLTPTCKMNCLEGNYIRDEEIKHRNLHSKLEENRDSLVFLKILHIYLPVLDHVRRERPFDWLINLEN